jgi:hypothetical protein
MISDTALLSYLKKKLGAKTIRAVHNPSDMGTNSFDLITALLPDNTVVNASLFSSDWDYDIFNDTQKSVPDVANMLVFFPALTAEKNNFLNFVIANHSDLKLIELCKELLIT